jgi:septal ring factor EnvC (AmiA/AmiB activator)
VKRPIAWHETCLTNQQRTLQAVEAEVQCHQRALQRLRADTLAYAEQIAAAHAEGKMAFDREKFLRRRKSQVPR